MKFKVNEKNMYAVMGKINTFFRKPTRRYLGIKKMYCGEKPITKPDGSIVCVPDFYEEECYKPYYGDCEEHHIRKKIRNELKNNELVTYDEHRISNTVLLAISDKYSSTCIPIKVGYVVEITGERLSIRQNDVVTHMDFYDGRTSWKNRDRSEYIHFYHMPISYEEELEVIRDGLYNLCSSYDINYLCTDIVDAYGELNFDLIKETHGNLLDLITDVIKNLDLTDDVFDKGYSFMGKELGIYIDIAANRNAVDLSGESFYVKVDEYKFYDWLELTVYLISDKIFWSDVDDENWD